MTLAWLWIREGSVAPVASYPPFEPPETFHLVGCTMPLEHLGACDASSPIGVRTCSKHGPYVADLTLLGCPDCAAEALARERRERDVQ